MYFKVPVAYSGLIDVFFFGTDFCLKMQKFLVVELLSMQYFSGLAD